MVTISKLDAAHRQLVVAIHMFFNDGDLASVHTLACAAREIYEKHLKARGGERMFDQIQIENPDKTEKELWTILNRARNFLKHPEDDFDLNASIELDDEGNASVLFIATHDCSQLCGHEQPPEAEVFNAWMVGTRFPDFTNEATAGDSASSRVAEFQRGVAATYPTLRRAPLHEQKRIGLQMLAQCLDLVAPRR